MEKTYTKIYDVPDTIVLDLENDYCLIKDDDGTRYYCKHDDYEKCKDHINLKIDIDPISGKSIFVDYKIAKLIALLNRCGYKTEYCCSGHICDWEDWYTDEDGKTIVIYHPDLDTNDCTSGYISFAKKYRNIEKAFTNKKLNCSYNEVNRFCREQEREFHFRLLDSICYVVRMRSQNNTIIYRKKKKTLIQAEIDKLVELFKANKFID